MAKLAEKMDHPHIVSYKDHKYHEQSKEHFGILLSDQVPLRDLLRRALRFFGRHTAEEVRNNAPWLKE